MPRSADDQLEVCECLTVFRLLGLLGGLAAVTDLGTGSAADESLLRCVVASRLARVADGDDDLVREVVYVSLLEHLGCTAYAHESGVIFGDDIVSTKLALMIDESDPRDLLRVWVPGMAAASGRSRTRVLTTTVRTMRKVGAVAPVATCEVATEAARRLGLPDPVQQGIHHVVTMWNGKGYPDPAGEQIPLSTRLMQVAGVAVMFYLHAGPEAAVAAVRQRSGTYLDPGLVDLFLPHAGDLWGDLHSVDAYQAALDSEPDPVHLVDEPELEAVARTFGDLIDLKSPWLQGHSAAVAELAAAATEGLGLNGDVTTVRIAGYLHDIGRVAVSSRIWSKAEPLSATEHDQACLHPYHGERVLARVPALSEVAQLAGQHHERLDGSGYHRGLTADRLSMAARVLATADAYQTLIEDRPDAAAVPADTAAKRLRQEARAGRLDGDAVEAVLEAAGHDAHARRSRPAGLTERQIEVLRLIAAGLSNRDIADRLVISRRTAEHHVQDVYTKIGASTRAAAALFAMEHGLLSRS
jgi:putative nucleotidyltransferase with HDIG domain